MKLDFYLPNLAGDYGEGEKLKVALSSQGKRPVILNSEGNLNA